MLGSLLYVRVLMVLVCGKILILMVASLDYGPFLGSRFLRRPLIFRVPRRDPNLEK